MQTSLFENKTDFTHEDFFRSIFIVQINDEEGGRGRKVYITNWGISVWKEYAKKMTLAECYLEFEQNKYEFEIVDYTFINTENKEEIKP
jgi:hypothetical protein